MDPNETLGHIQTEIDKYNRGEAMDEHILVEHLEALLEWLAKGGFPPDWKRVRR